MGVNGGRHVTGPQVRTVEGVQGVQHPSSVARVGTDQDHRPGYRRTRRDPPVQLTGEPDRSLLQVHGDQGPNVGADEDRAVASARWRRGRGSEVLDPLHGAIQPLECDQPLAHGIVDHRHGGDEARSRGRSLGPEPFRDVVPRGSRIDETYACRVRAGCEPSLRRGLHLQHPQGLVVRLIVLVGDHVHYADPYGPVTHLVGDPDSVDEGRPTGLKVDRGGIDHLVPVVQCAVVDEDVRRGGLVPDVGDLRPHVNPLAKMGILVLHVDR